LFEVAKIIQQVLARNLIELLDAYGLINKIITYVKDEGSNLNTLTNALKFGFQTFDFLFHFCKSIVSSFF
jgi:hypothetical protein